MNERVKFVAAMLEAEESFRAPLSRQLSVLSGIFGFAAPVRFRVTLRPPWLSRVSLIPGLKRMRL